MWRGSLGQRVALFAALVLVLQSLGASFLSGAAGFAAPRDAFGNPLCITSGEHSTPASGDSGIAFPGCCTLGCSSGWVGIGPAPSAVRWNIPVFTTEVVLGRVFILGKPCGVFRTPHQPRAPPLTA